MTKRELGPSATGTTPREQRMAAAGRVAAGLMHEFRNVLAPIANLAYLLEQEADNPMRVRELAQRLAQLAQVRGRVLDRLRDFLRQDAERFPDDAVLDVAAAARDTVALCATLATSRTGDVVALRCDADEPLYVAGHGTELRTAIFELVLNAIEATPAGGTVRVRTFAQGDTVRLEVRDGGAGVPGGMADEVFDPFISTKAEPDAGLGLSAVWAIAQRHHGDVTIEAHPSGGTVVTLTLPRALAVR